ncbi:hypothetical protein Ocin01_06053 [Orchesella cincta]|uniref:Ferric-chelate reductase 1 n=1 Tax=Orchesella cincta TaxID=48709 RepID=A0A1D2N5R1_ORCCI|nr:hypothetical protein Ocin01_06053 [Orchesella cincta]
MLIFYLRGILLLLYISEWLLLATSQPRANYHIGYRKVNWCVTGRDEPELHEFPYSQFVPLLRRTNRLKLDSHIRYDLRFFDITTTQNDVGLGGRLFKTTHVVFKAEQLKDPEKTTKQVWEPMEIEGLVIQANSNPYTLALPTGQFFRPGADKDHIGEKDGELDVEIHCEDCDNLYWAGTIMCRKRAITQVEHPNILAWHYKQLRANETRPIHSSPSSGDDDIPSDPGEIPSPGPQSEVHSNFRFYSPKCAPTRRLMFTILVVRSFARQEYDIFYRGPYEVTVRDQENQSDLHPSPYFYLYTQVATCHHHSSSDITLEHPKKFEDFEMNHFFDCCIREEENRKTKITVELFGWQRRKSVSCLEKLYRKHTGPFDPRTIESGEESFQCFYPHMPRNCEDKDFESAKEHYDRCPPCEMPPTTTTMQPTTKPPSIYKRTVHGGLMIMTNFCLQPIVIYIARFYKETFNTKSYKGSKSWYWMHLLGGMVSSGMIYFGYFSGGHRNPDEVRGHVAIGNVYIITLAFCYLTAWGRHKDTFVTTIAELIHSCFGYVTISLAIASVESAPGLGFTSKMLVYLMVATQLFFMIILSMHICLLDKKLGMKPKRRHFPTVEARFDEIAVPKAKFRIIMLVIFSSITFCLSFASTFFE